MLHMSRNQTGTTKICWYAPWFSSMRSNYLRILEEQGFECHLVTSQSHFDPTIELFHKSKVVDLNVSARRKIVSLVSIYRHITGLKPDLIFCDIPSRPPQCLLVLFLLISNTGLIAIDDVVPHDKADVPSRLVSMMHRMIVRRAAGIVTFSCNSAELAKNRYKDKPVFSVPLVPEISVFSDMIPIPQKQKKNFVMIGRWSEYKGFDLGAEIFCNYLEKHPSESILDIWCSGIEKPPFEHPNIVWRSLSSFSWQELSQTLPSYKAVLMPYRTASQSAVQNLSWDAGVPCLVSNLAGLIETQPPDLPAIPIDDVDAWTQAIFELDNENAPDKIAIQGQEFSRSIRSKEIVAQSFVMVIESAVGNG